MANPTVATDPHSISQGNIQNTSDLVFGTPTGDAVTITSIATEIPVMVDKEFFEIRNHPQATNNGLYRVDDSAPAAGTVDVRKVSGADPVVDATGRDCDILCSLDTAVADGVWANQVLDVVEITSVGGNLPTSLVVGSRFQVRDHSDADNNGVYQVDSAVTNGFSCTKLSGAEPNNGASEPVTIYSEVKSVFYDVAAKGLWLLEQRGTVVTALTDAVWGTPTGALVNISSAGNQLPVVRIGQKVLFELHATAANNGFYVIRGITTATADWDVEMVSDGLTPASAVAEALNVYTDPAVDDTGALGQPLYSRIMIDYKDDNFFANNSDFPMFNIDSDAGKYLVGQDASGNNSGWNFVDNAEFGVRSRKLVRNMGWQEINSAGLVTAEYAAIRSNATVEDINRDLGYYQFGTDTTTDDTVDFEFAGAVDEAIKVFDATVSRGADDYAFASAGNTITRLSGDWIADGYKVGSRIITANADEAANDGTRVITALTTTIATVEETDGTTTSFTLDASDVNATHDLDNRFAFSLKLRPRDDDALGKSFAQQGLADALATQLSNRAFIFGLGTVEDSNITNTDATVSAYGVTITFFATPQSKGAATLVGGAQTFGIVIEGNSKTATEIYEAIQYSLRLLTDIDAGAGTNLGRTIDGLVRFNGSVLEFGSVDGGLSFPNNPESGVADGVYCDNVAAADANNVKFWDSTNTLRSNKETIAITLDVNQILIDDSVAEATLYYDRTERTIPADLVVNAGGTFTSAGANLPVLDGGNGAYVRLSGFLTTELAANGIYQVVTETSQSSWTVVRYDNAAMITTGASAIIPIDEHPFNAPDSIVVDTTNLITDTTISFTAPDTIGDTGSGFGIFSIGDSIRITGGPNDGLICKVLTVSATTITIEQGQFDPTITTQAAGASYTITEVARVDASGDFAFNYGFDDNTQGGRDISTQTYVRAKAIGRVTAQYTSSAVLSIVSQTPLTVPLQSQQERNVVL